MNRAARVFISVLIGVAATMLPLTFSAPNEPGTLVFHAPLLQADRLFLKYGLFLNAGNRIIGLVVCNVVAWALFSYLCLGAARGARRQRIKALA